MRGHLSTLFHYRWALPVLVDLYRLDAAKFARLAHRFTISRQTLRTTLRGLVRQRLVTVRKVRYGSSLRDEYTLTPRGSRAARAGASLLFAIRRLRIQRVALRKWTLSIMFALRAGQMGFNQLRRSQASITPRALAAVLRALGREGIIGRHVTSEWPPATRYRLQPNAGPVVQRLLPHLERLQRALSE